MNLRDVPIKKKLTTAIMLTSTVVLFLTSVSFITYEVIAQRKSLLEHLQTIAQITAANSSAAVSFSDEKTSTEILSKLHAEQTILLACIYEKNGKMLARFPAEAPVGIFPPQPQAQGHSFEAGTLNLFFPVEEDNRFIGTLFLKMDMAPLYRRVRSYGEIVFLVMIGSIGVALFLSSWLQRRISGPILELAATAKAVSVNKDYRVRAKKYGEDELGLFTDAFNHMLTQIHERDLALRENEEQLRHALLASEAAAEEVRALNAALEERVLQRTSELNVSTNQELEAFTYSVSHDLRAPLRHIDGFAQILEEQSQTELNADSRKILFRIRQGVQNMGRLVDDLLNLSRIGRDQIKQEKIQLKEIVSDVIAETKPEWDGRNLEWRVGPLPSVRGDPGLIKQIFINLISNAIKYTRPRPKAVIEIGSETVEGAPAVFVKDNGVGFNMKYADKLFGVFQRLHRAEEFEGTGVGLATVRRIVLLHEGKIWVEAELDKGATFHFTLKGMQPP